MANSILYSEVNLVCIFVLALIANKVRKSAFVQTQRQLFYNVLIIDTAFLVIDAVWIFINNQVFGIASVTNWVLNIIYFVLSGMLGFSWFAYSETIQHSCFVTDKKMHRISLIPFLLLLFLSVTTPLTGWLFYIDAENVYHRGPAYFVQLLCAYGYVIFTGVKAMYKAHKATDYQQKAEIGALSRFIIPTLAFGALQVVFSGYPLLPVGNTAGLLYVFLTLQEQLISVDPLTKLNNRNQFYQHYSAKMNHLPEGRDLYLLLMDIDRFKAINDQYGHVEGDNALKAVAATLKAICHGKRYFVSRYGGDEFIMMCELEPAEQIETVCDTIHTEIAKIEVPYKLKVSIGTAKYTPNIATQQQFIALADAELYKAKKNRE